MSYYNDPIETETYRGFTIDILPDEDPPNPRRDYDPFGTMVCFHRDYDLGDKGHGYNEGDYTGWAGLHDAIAADHPGAVILPLALLDHSGITMTVGARGAFVMDAAGWDSGQVGWIFATREQVHETFGDETLTVERIREVLVGEVEQYARYLEGAGIVYRVTAPNGVTIEGCSGFFDTADALTEARADVDSHVKWLDHELDDVRDVTKGIALVALAGGAS